MSRTWRASPQLEAMLAELIDGYERDYAKIGFPYYPSVMWSLGGEAWKDGEPEGQRISLPAEYSVGFYKRDPLPVGDGFVFVASEPFGLIVFLPRPDDLASDRRLIDVERDEIVVR
jgi:hypothetical protein